MFRKPPSDVDRMTSLRVGNLPFRTTSEVRKRVAADMKSISSHFNVGVTASVWEVWRCWRHLSSSGARVGTKPWICLCQILREERCRGKVLVWSARAQLGLGQTTPWWWFVFSVVTAVSVCWCDCWLLSVRKVTKQTYWLGVAWWPHHHLIFQQKYCLN